MSWVGHEVWAIREDYGASRDRTLLSHQRSRASAAARHRPRFIERSQPPVVVQHTRLGRRGSALAVRSAFAVGLNSD
jgi:hypothetical protein